MYLHEDREMFRTIVEQVAEESGEKFYSDRKRLLCDNDLEITIRAT